MSIVHTFNQIFKDLNISSATDKRNEAVQARTDLTAEYNKLKKEYTHANPIKKKFIALKIYQINNKINWTHHAEKHYNDRIQNLQKNEKFKRDKFAFTEELKFGIDNDKFQRKNEGAIHHGRQPVGCKGAKITNKGKVVVAYDHYNDKSNCCEFDLSRAYTHQAYKNNRIMSYIADSFSIKLGDDKKIDWSLPENIEILEKCPEALPEVLRKYPESYKTIPAKYATRNAKALITAVKDGVKDKITRGEIPPKEDGSDKNDMEYMQETVDMVKDKFNEVQDYKTDLKQKAQKRTQVKQDFADMENSYGK